MSTVYVVGLGPGAGEQMTVRAEKILEACPVILGYTVYIDLVREQYPEKKFLSTPMKQEVKRLKAERQEMLDEAKLWYRERMGELREENADLSMQLREEQRRADKAEYLSLIHISEPTRH